MRPKSVIHAERVYAAAIVLLLATSVLSWTDTVAAVGAGIAAGVTAFTVGLFVLLLLLTTRRASTAALWLLVALTAVGVGSLLWQIGTGTVAFGAVGILNAVETALTVIGAVLLFRPNARLWFAERHVGWEEDL